MGTWQNASIDLRIPKAAVAGLDTVFTVKYGEPYEIKAPPLGIAEDLWRVVKQIEDYEGVSDEPLEIADEGDHWHITGYANNKVRLCRWDAQRDMAVLGVEGVIEGEVDAELERTRLRNEHVYVYPGVITFPDDPYEAEEA